MSTQQASFGMAHKQRDSELKVIFDDQFENWTKKAGIASLDCTGSCLCSLSCDCETCGGEC
ncbi:hypothetical protein CHINAEXTREME_20765 (plasmid) [Halobiforma lacisalsi AJ5]|uniref:Uncharacterized protein n=1 Tax=Natronobacterium lacisalsi AJ5 TaxID=358396 RepID=A0A1P8LWR1_NATLA|nr:hypothetical protein [Halobiforma lacisalsi]APX00241.1 hypothetical protein CHINAEXTREME_20765 [Halobiforma lacisalsi AJ5]